MKYFGFILILILFTKAGASQENYASNISKSISDGEKLLITYDITPSEEARSFRVILLLTYEGRPVEASAAYGDIGANISPGKEKAIVWYFKDDFDGDIENVDVDVYAYKENEPQAIFEIVSIGNNGYAPCEIVFSNNSSFANEYQWNFGDPASGTRNLSFEKDPFHVFEKGGIYSISLTARNTQSGLENTYYQSIEIKRHDPTIAGFEIDGNNQLAPAKVSFRNTSENADTYRWNFGDPSGRGKNESDKKSPGYKYKNPGTYTVRLIVRNNFSGMADTIAKEVIVEQEKVAEAGFVYTKSSETAPSIVAFKNTSANAVKYKWDFGDSPSGDKNSSEEAHPAHTYTKPGNYTVKLSAWGRDGKKPSTYSESVAIKELPKPPEAQFSIQKNNVLGPATIIFNNNSVNAEEYSWDFGDPDSGDDNYSDKKNPSHTYEKAGRYKVVLTVGSSDFTTESTATDYVIITAPSLPPVAKFTIGSNNLSSPAEISFINSSANTDRYSWDFGDPQSAGNRSAEISPSHIYNKPGTYKVVLTATNEETGEESVFSDFVTVAEPPKPVVAPVARFIFEMGKATAPAVVRFFSSSTDADTYEWNFGDPGSAQNTSAVSDPVHSYLNAGRYRVILTVANKSSGLKDTRSEYITVSQPLVTPVAEFEIENNNAEAPATIVFSNNSENAGSYAWDFGDPSSGAQNTSVLENPEHTYQNPGEYKVVLAALNKESGKEAVTEKNVVVTKPPEPPSAGFEIVGSSESVPVRIDFENRSENADSYKWNFGDFGSEENESSEASPSHYYTIPGKYEITLDASNSQTGESRKLSKEITLKSDFKTFVKSDEFNRENTNTLSVIQVSDNTSLALLESGGGHSNLISINNEGSITGEKNLDYQVFDVLKGDEEGFTLLGIDNSGHLFIQKVNRNLETGDRIVFQENKSFKTDFARPALSLSSAGEIGVIANTINDRYPINLSFQKADKSGRIIPLMERTFKYVGTKLATDMVPTEDGGFALTGYWKEDDNSSMLILFGKIDRNGRGDIHLINSEVSILGCKIEETYHRGYAILELKEDIENLDFYKMSLFLVDDDGSPTECATKLPCSVKKEDILKYRPGLIKTETGYLVASHSFNGLDYDVFLFWVDKAGNNLLKYKDLRLPGDQFVMDLVQVSDGGFLISGTQHVNGEEKAMVIKTDPNGILNPDY